MKNLYVVDFGTGDIKIGVTSNVEKRIAGIRTSSGISSSAKNIFTIQDSKETITKIEQATLTLMAKFKTNGEWFVIDFDSAVSVVKMVQSEVLREKSITGDCFDSLVSNFVGKTRVSLTDIAAAINKQQRMSNKPLYQLGAFLNSKMVSDYIDAASKEWNIAPEEMIARSGKSSGSTVAHVSVGVLFLESADIKAKAKIHKALIDGWHSEFLRRGGTEFKNLNAAIEEYLPDCQGKDNKEVFIAIAKAIRERILGPNAKAEDWDFTGATQAHLRYEWENKLCEMLRLGVIRDYDHLKELILKL